MKEKLLGIAITVLVLTMLFTSPFLFNIKPAKALIPPSSNVFGNTTLGNITHDISSTKRLTWNFTASYNGIAKYINASIATDINNITITAYCAIYYSNLTLLTNTTGVTLTANSTPTWYQFDFDVPSQKNIYAGTNYALAIYGGTSSGGAVYICCNGTQTGDGLYDFGIGWEDPFVPQGPATNVKYSLFCGYTPLNYGKYIKCYFNNAGGDTLVNFTTSINVSSTSIFWNYVNSSAYDVIFVDEDNTTELYYETEKWNYAAKSCLFWVRVPQINASNTDFIYLYYYFPSVSSYTSYKDYTKVWTQWNAVYHLYENTGNFNDSSPNAYNMVANHSPIRNVSAVFDNGMEFAVSDYLESTSSCGNFTYTDAFSLSAWFRSNKTVSDPHFFVNKLINSGTYRGYEWYLQNGGTGAIYFYLISDFGANNYLGLHSTLNITDNDWHQIAVTYNGNSSQYGVTLYIDGAVAAVNYDHNTLSATTYNTIATDIGALGAGATPVSQHMEDETRIIKTNLTTGWINAEYNCGIGTFVTFVVSKVWFDAETWNGRLYNYSWYGVENWIGQMATAVFNNAELWNGLLTPKLFYNAELWNGLLSTLGFRNVETWSGILRTLQWFTAEHWETNYTDIQEQDVLISSVDNTFLNFTRVGVSPYINTYGTDTNYIVAGVGVGNYMSGNYSIQDWELLKPTIKFEQILNITMVAHTYYPFPFGGTCSYGIFPNGTYLTQTGIGWYTGNRTIGDIKPYINGINDFRNLKLVVNATTMGQIRCDMVTFKVYYYPKYLAIGNWLEFNLVEKWIIRFGEEALITFVRWSILGLGVGFLLLAMILLYVGFKMRNGVVLIAALIVFLLGIMMAIAGAGI